MTKSEAIAKIIREGLHRETPAKLAEQFGVSVRTVYRWLEVVRRFGYKTSVRRNCDE